MYQGGGSMELGFDISVGLTQKTVLSQRMKLSLDILQMTSGELKKFLEREGRRNHLMRVELPGSRGGKAYRDEEYDPYIEVEADEPSLYDFLYRQVGEMSMEGHMKEICEYIIDNIDSKGYLSHWVRHPYDQFDFDRGLEIVRSLEPRGVAADDLRECLLLQIEKDEHYERVVIESYLEELAYGSREKIAKELKIDRGALERVIERIRSLNPIPARGYRVESKMEKLVPDAYLRVNEEGIEIEINEEAIPRVLVEQAEMAVQDPRYKRYLERCKRRAEFIIACIRQRQETLERVLRETVDIQREYIRGGELKPLTLMAVAERLDLHQSTVSRAIKNRYVDIGGSTISLKRLFAKRFRSREETQGGLTRECIKEKLYELISTENKNKPYTDEEIVDRFKEEGIAVARRTVAKYRGELKIPSSGRRRRRIS